MLVNLEVKDEFYDTFKELISVFKKEVELVDVYKEDDMLKMVAQAREDYRLGKTVKVTDEELDV
jgi:hypothetical protein